MKTRSQNSCCIGRRADKSGPHAPVRNQAGVEKYAFETNHPKTHFRVTRTAQKQTLDPQKQQNHQTKKTFKEKNALGKSSKKSWKPTTMQNIIPQKKVMQNKHIQSGGNII